MFGIANSVVYSSAYSAFPQLASLSPETRRRPLSDLPNILQVSPTRFHIQSSKSTIAEALDQNDLVIEQMQKKERTSTEYLCTACDSAEIKDSTYSSKTPEEKEAFLLNIIGDMRESKKRLDYLEGRVGVLEEFEEMFTPLKSVALRCFADDQLRRKNYAGKDLQQFLNASGMGSEEKALLERLREGHAEAQELPICVVAKALDESRSQFSDLEWNILEKWFTESTQLSVKDAVGKKIGAEGGMVTTDRSKKFWSDFRSLRTG